MVKSTSTMAQATLANTTTFKQVEHHIQESLNPCWLKVSRQQYWEAAQRMPLPEIHDLGWQGTDLSHLKPEQLQLIDFGPHADQPLPEVLVEAMETFGPQTAICFPSSGNKSYLSISLELKAKGVVLCDLKTALSQYSELIKPYLNHKSLYREDKFTLLCKACFNGGFFLYVPPNLELEEPILTGTACNTTSIFPAQAGLFPRNIVVAGENSSFKLINLLESSSTESSAPLLACDFTEIFVGCNSSLQYLELKILNHNTTNIGRVISEVEQNGRFNSLTCCMGGKLTKADIVTYLQAPGAESNLLGVALGMDTEHYNFNTLQEHYAPDTISNINFKVALKDNSSSSYQGTITIAKDAQRTNAYQSNKNLLLSPGARAASVPRLEILADDVHCSHGATVSSVDEEQLFYLRSRGLPATTAEELIVSGFFEPVLAKLEHKGTYEWLQQLISCRIMETSKISKAVQHA